MWPIKDICVIELSGSAGRLYSGHKVAITVSKWHISRGGPRKPLADQSADGVCVIRSFDRLHVNSPITKASMRVGAAWWTWGQVEILGGDQVIGGIVRFKVYGEPEINVDTDVNVDHFIGRRA